MYNDMYNNFDDSIIDYSYPFSFDEQNRSYLKKKTNILATFQNGFDMNFSFPLEVYLTVAEDDIISETASEVPTAATVGKLYQKYYNIVDEKSWTCTNIAGTTYTWTLNAVFQDNENGTKKIVLPNSYLTGKDLEIKFYDFRYGEIYKKELTASNLVEFTIPADESFGKGLYQMSVDLIKNKGQATETTKRIINPENCCIIVG